MTNKSFIIILALAAILGLTALGCSSGGTSKVTVRINLPAGEHAFNAPALSIFDRILSFFAREAAAAAPSNLVSLELNVSGGGMAPINLSYSAPFPSSVSVEVPSGSGRLFELLAHTPSVTFRGTATKDLASGATEDIPIVMALYETKIIIPDSYNNRIVQINDDFSGWQTNNLDYYINGPKDIEFDSKGRIYITNYDHIIRMNDITSSSYEIVVSSTEGYYTFAIDRNNNTLYINSGQYLGKCNLEGPRDPYYGYEMTDLYNSYDPELNIMSINDMTVDENGILFIAGQDNYQSSSIFKYDPNILNDNGESPKWKNYTSIASC